MDESALKVLISNLERSRATLDLWLFIFTLFVVVGVVLEVVFVIWEYRDELHDWRRGIAHPPEKPSIALLVFGLFGVGLVAIGVTGELYIGAKIGAKETSIREANDQRASLLSKLAGDAAQSAKTAHDEADAVKAIADEARADAKDALVKAQTAQHELAHAEADAAKAQTVSSNALSKATQAESHLNDALQRAASAEQESAKLKKRFSERTLDEAQAESIAAKIKPFAGQEFDVTPYWDLPESFKIADRITGILNSPLAGWKYIPPEKSGFMLGGTAGVQVWVHPAAPDSVKKAADALVSALNAENITAYIKEQNPKNPIDSKIHLNVGTKE